MKTLFIFFSMVALNGLAQFKAPTSLTAKTPYFEKHFLVGFAVNNSWSSYRDLQGDSAFYRPSLGIHLKTEYFFRPFIGISIGAGFQQRGMGIITPDLDQSIGNQDSTGRLRYITNTFDFPVMLVLRTPKNIFRGTRLSLGLGADFSVVKKAVRVWKSVDDGFHDPIDITDRYQKLDIPLRASIGFDVEAGVACLFRAHIYGEMGTKYLYTNPISGTKSSQNVLLGIDLNFLF
jgi:hypothetical protein